MNKYKRNIMITGGAGFIGSHLVRYMTKQYPEYFFLVVDKFTYAGRKENLEDIKETNYKVSQSDITDKETMLRLMKEYGIDSIIHLAAESHVDNSINDPLPFITTNIVGTYNLLECARQLWTDGGLHKFYHVSTDEVYGSLSKNDPAFTENNKYEPHSPYSASKASSDHLVRAYHDTFGLPINISNCSNNYGTHQHEEKLIPRFLTNIVNNQPLPVYGTGENIRDWLHVTDHCRAIDTIFHNGTDGETYNIGGNNEHTNIDIIHKLIRIADEELNREAGTSEKLITYVTDRKGHDLRYAINSTKLQTELNWKPQVNFEDGLREVVKWYIKKVK